MILIASSFLHSPLRAADAVPAPSVHAQRMAAVQVWLEEDIASAKEFGLSDMVAARQADLAKHKTSPPAETANTPHPDLVPPIKYLEGNPIVEEFFKNLQRKTLNSDKRFPKGPEGAKGRSEEGWVFIVRANELLDLTQAFCHPQSKMVGSPQLVVPILRRLAIFAEYMVEGGPVLGDFGPCGTVAEAWLILRTCRPEIVPPSLQKEMDQGVRNNANIIISKNPGWFQPPSPTTPCLVNADVNLVLAVAITNQLSPSPEYAAAIKGGLAYIEPHILPDGATNYVEQQNECAGYHGAAVYSLARTAQVTGLEQPLEMVKRLRWYYPLVVSPTGVMEWSTATSWHHYWNTANGANGAALMAELTNCPHNQRVANLGYKGNLWEASFWNPQRVAAPFPDNYVTYDRNVEGPRARYDTWYYVGTTRKTYDNRGKSSYVGCVIETGKPGAWQLDSALQDAGMEIRLNPSKDSDTEHRGRITLAHEEPITTSAVGERAAALGAVAKLGSYRKPVTDWITRQAWLFTPERMVGLVTLEAGEELTGAGIFGRLFLVSGRATWGVRKELKELSPGNFSYGAMTVTFHAHDFAGFEHEYSDVMGGGLNQSSAKKSCRLMLVDEAAKSGDVITYSKGTSHFYLVELRPATSAPATVSREKNDAGLLAFTVKDGSGSYRVAFNPTDQPVDFLMAPAKVLHRSGEKFRAAWLKEAGVVESVAPIPAPASYRLPAGEIVFGSEQ